VETDAAESERIEVNGAPARADQLRHLALVNYGHFTSMQVRDGAVRGLGLHLERLDRASHELFGRGLDPDRVRDCIRHGLGDGVARASVRVNVFSHDRIGPGPVASELDILVRVSAPASEPSGPLRVRSVHHERVLPHVKHLGTFGLTHHHRRAQQDGFDDALFTNDAGSISEATIWNVGFFDGSEIVWPSAPALDGITLQLVRAGMDRRGVPSTTRDVRLADLRSVRSAFLTNSIAIIPIASVDDVELVVDHDLMALLRDALESNPWEPIRP
jgi:4-amino-4-deoxychorismate lyase